MIDNEIQNIATTCSFQWANFWTALSAISALIASIVALYLSNSYKRTIITVTGYKIDKLTFDEKQAGERNYQEISIYNASQRKVRLQDYGYMVGGVKYTTDSHRIVYNLVRPRKEKIENPFNKNAFTRTVLDEVANHLPFYIFDGEDCNFGLFPGDYTFNILKNNKKLYVYLKINEKIYKYNTGIKLKKYLSLTKNIKDKSPNNKG